MVFEPHPSQNIITVNKFYSHPVFKQNRSQFVIENKCFAQVIISFGYYTVLQV